MAANWKEEMARRGVDDMTLLSKISENGILENLSKRYMVDEIFTYIGEVLISVNPYKMLPCCSPDLIPKYRGKNRLEMPANIFALADDTYRTMLNESQNQCVIISGESGAGKTEASKLIMKYIAAVSGSSAGVEHVKNIILESNPLLESFGNAKTVRNNNSSRFGKFFEIQFNAMGDPDGGRITNYLLEKSRVTFQNRDERNFHVFYQILSGMSGQEKDYFQLWSTNDYFYLNQSGCDRVDGINDNQEYNDMRHAMGVIGIPDATQNSIMQLLAAILHLGNLQFRDTGKEGCEVSDKNALQIAAQMLEIDPYMLETNLLFRVMTTGFGGRGSVYNVPLNSDQARYARDALAQTMYSRMFDYLVSMVNAAMSKQQESISICVLDIYGFEIFQKNGFEQFCINYVNEKLQQIFIELTLKSEQEEYVREGIQWTPIDYFNNKIVCDLCEAKRPPGIFCVLDDVCATIHGQSDGVDEKFVQKLDGLVSSHPHYESRYPCFLVRHYAGDVNYNCDGFTDRNKDTLSKELLTIAKSSGNQFIASIFPEPIPGPNDKKRNTTTAGKRIVKSAGELVTALMACTPHYIRCIKPNETKRPRDLDSQRIIHQIRYLGLLENVRIRRAGFAYRQTFDRFLYRFAILSPQTWPSWSGDDRSGCECILRDMRVAGDQWQLGVTKVFLRLPETLFAMEEARDRKFHDCALHIQRAYRFWKSQKFYNDLKMSQVQLFQGRKERRRNSLDREFLGDYLGYKENFLLQEAVRMAGGYEGEQIMFADHCDKYDRRFKVTKRDILVSDVGIYVIGLDQVKKGPNKGEFFYAVKRRIDLRAVASVSMSNLADDFIIINVNGEHDNLISLKRKTELMCTINFQLQKKGGQLMANFANQLPYVLKDNKGTRTVIFQPDQSGQLPDVAFKASGKKLVVTAPRGLDPNSMPTSTYVPPDASQRRKFGDGQGGFRPGAGREVLDPRAAFQARNQAAGGLVKKPVVAGGRNSTGAGGGGRGGFGGGGGGSPRGRGGGGAARGRAASRGRGGGSPRGRGGGGARGGPRGGGARGGRGGGRGGGGGGGGPQCRALYDYNAGDTDEISFRAGDVINITDSSDTNGWWLGTLNGQSGSFPANYVQKI